MATATKFQKKINTWTIEVNERNTDTGAASGWLCNSRTCQSFIEYSQGGTIAYDYPEGVPPYIQREIKKALTQAEKHYKS